MGSYDVQQVCLKGHQITAHYNSSPQFRRDYCPECGSKTLHACPNCGKAIPGYYHEENVFYFAETPVPTHCESCGKPYPWKKVNFNTSLPSWYRELSMVQNVGLLGSIASIIALALYFLPAQTASQETNTNAYGDQSPAIGSNQGSVTINYGNKSKQKVYVLRNQINGATLLVDKPSLDAAMNPEQHVCMAPAGTSISLTGKTAKMGQIDKWREVEIIDGECAKKRGWVSMENISLE